MPQSLQYSHIINNLPGILYLFDHNGKFLLWNKNFEEKSGYTPEEIRQMHPTDFFAGNDKIFIAERIQKVFSEDKADAVADFINKSGIKTPYYFTGSFIEIDSMPCLIGMGIDISERIAAELNLQESELRYRQIVETTHEGIWLINEGGITTFVNEQMAFMLGYKREEMIGKHLFYFMEESEQDIANQNLSKRKMGLTDQHEFKFKKKNGEPLWTLINASPIQKDGMYAGAIAMIADITERKKAEEKLKQSEQTFKALVQNGSDLVAIIDEVGNYKYVSPTVTSILGFEVDHFKGRNAFEFIHPEDQPMIQEELQSLFTKGRLLSSPYRFIDAKGEWRWLESRGTNLLHDPNINGFVINTRDITESVLLQQALNQKNKESQQLITTAVINAQEGERSQLGLELHDNVNQVLTTVKLYNEMLRDGIGDPKDLLTKSMHHLQSCINEIRSISKRLSAPTLGNINLVESLKELFESINITGRLNITYTIKDISSIQLPQQVHLGVYRIVQEHLNNIIKHAEANFVVIEIEIKNHQLCLAIKDDGKGFNINQKRDGIGITNMNARAENLNGTFSIVSAPQKGCLMEVKIPV